MDNRRRILTALLLAILGTLCLGGAAARADETAATVCSPLDILWSDSSRDLFANELQKRQVAEEHVAICETSVLSLPAAKSTRSSRSGQGDCARDTGAELVFPGLADLWQDFPPPADAAAPATPALALPPARSPPVC